MFRAVIVFTAVLINPRLQKMLSGKGFLFLGRISYAMYVIHFLLLGSFSSWLFINLHSRFNYNLSFAIAATLSFGILIFASYVLTKYIDEPVTIRPGVRTDRRRRADVRQSVVGGEEKRRARTMRDGIRLSIRARVRPVGHVTAAASGEGS